MNNVLRNMCIFLAVITVSGCQLALNQDASINAEKVRFYQINEKILDLGTTAVEVTFAMGYPEYSEIYNHYLASNNVISKRLP